MGLLDKLFNKKVQNSQETGFPGQTERTSGLMTSQFAALFLENNNERIYFDIYIHRLTEIGFTRKQAEKMFDFEVDIIRRFGKAYLSMEDFTKAWFFSLRQPFFVQYPKNKNDILIEKYFTMSELCKLIDEAEWHYWNSHERIVSDDVWEEIIDWRLDGAGGDFAETYFEMLANETGIPFELINRLCSEQGSHLSRYKWG